MAFRVGFDDVVIDTSGNALSNVEISVYKVGTSELQTIYNERAGGTTKTNPFTTTSNGRVSFYIESPRFDIKVKDLNVPERFTERTVTVDRVPGEGSSAQVLVSNAGGLFVPATMSGDATISNTGALSVGEEKIESKHIKQGTIVNADLASEAKPLDWYAPKIIATEQSRESTSFATLTTADEIQGIVLPENGLIEVSYACILKSSVAGAARVAMFLGSNMVTGLSSVSEATGISGTAFATLGTVSGGTPLAAQNERSSYATTGVGVSTFCIFAAAGTYNLSIQFRATSGSVTAKERKLWARVVGI